MDDARMLLGDFFGEVRVTIRELVALRVQTFYDGHDVLFIDARLRVSLQFSPFLRDVLAERGLFQRQGNES